MIKKSKKYYQKDLNRFELTNQINKHNQPNFYLMKQFLLTLFLLASLNVVCQNHLEAITFEETQTSEFFRNIKNRTTVSTYTAADGSELKVGDTLMIGTPSGSTTNTTAVGAGSTFGAAKAKSKTASSFSNIIMGKPAGFGNVMNALGGEGPSNAGQNMQGEVVLISEISLFHKGSKKKPLAVQILLGEPNGRAFGINKYMSVTDYEKAVLAGEIKSTNAPLTRDEAIAKLKESKELLDLGIIEEEEYEELKSELMPIITGQ
ncbi:hypothetical protein [Christiangramia portivictoriae]|uniref:hypothetical protein n=1 Tax=Christiangramia portivictoriae TaxID=326069 RepID=UPI000479E0CC|nr:hypothetical protein [Christiangramia portivictoriae]